MLLLFAFHALLSFSVLAFAIRAVLVRFLLEIFVICHTERMLLILLAKFTAYRSKWDSLKTWKFATKWGLNGVAYQHVLTTWDVRSIMKRDRDAFNSTKRASICSCLSSPFSCLIDASPFERVLCVMRCDILASSLFESALVAQFVHHCIFHNAWTST